MELSKNTKSFIFWLVMFTGFMFVDMDLEYPIDGETNKIVGYWVKSLICLGLLFYSARKLGKSMEV